MDVSVEIHCGLCGSANYSLPDDSGEQDPVRCNDCGVPLGSLADLQAEMLVQARARSAETLRRELDHLADSASPSGDTA